MSKTTKPDTTTDEQTEKDAETLREYSDDLDTMGRRYSPALDEFLRDLQQGAEQAADIIEHENGEITVEELQKRVFPTGGPR